MLPHTKKLLTLAQDLKDDAELVLLKRAGVRGIVGSKRDDLVEIIIEKRVSDAKLSRDQHLERIVEAYATYVYLSSEPGIDEVMNDIADRIGYRITKATDPIRIIVGSAISYGSDYESEMNKNSTRLYSRDVKAIRSLIERGVKPSELFELSKRPGEGLDYWSCGSKSSKPASRAQASIRIQVRGVDGKSRTQLIPVHFDRACTLFLEILSGLGDFEPGKNLT